jgi:Alpha/beta hydrolase
MPTALNLNKGNLDSSGDIVNETVILVHGTFANSESKSPAWWEPRSDFVKELDATLAAGGSVARCWAGYFFKYQRPAMFAWTGDNSQSQRRAASRALAELLVDFERTMNFRYHIVAHSHGGNVVLNALDALARDPQRLGAVVFLGTPALKFTAAPRLSLRVQRYGPGIAFAAGFLTSVWLSIVGGGWSRVAAIAIATILGLVLLLEFGRLLKDPVPKRKRSSLYGTGRPFAYVFDSDEAIAGLTRTVQAMERPRELIEKLMPINSARKFACEPWEHREAIRFLDTWPGLSLQSMRGGWRNRERSFWVQIALMPIFLLACAIGAVPYLMIVGWQAFTRTLSSLTAKFRRWLLNYPGASLVGRVVTSAAVGADQGRFESVSSLPPGVQAGEAISEDLQVRMRACTRAALATVGESLGAQVFGLSFEELAASVDRSDTSVQLAHSQYYREPAIVKGIAARICENSWRDIPQHPISAKPSAGAVITPPAIVNSQVAVEPGKDRPENM